MRTMPSNPSVSCVSGNEGDSDRSHCQTDISSGPCFRSDHAYEAELLGGVHSIIQTDLLHDLAVLNPKHRRPGESHRSAGCRWQRPDEEVAEGRAGVRAATFPATNHIVALGDEVRSAPEVEVRERFTQPGPKCLDIRMAATRRTQ